MPKLTISIFLLAILSTVSSRDYYETIGPYLTCDRDGDCWYYNVKKKIDMAPFEAFENEKFNEIDDMYAQANESMDDLASSVDAAVGADPVGALSDSIGSAVDSVDLSGSVDSVVGSLQESSDAATSDTHVAVNIGIGALFVGFGFFIALTGFRYLRVALLVLLTLGISYVLIFCAGHFTDYDLTPVNMCWIFLSAILLSIIANWLIFSFA